MASMYSAVVSILGLIGLGAITLIPLRAWHLSRRYFRRHASSSSRWLAALIGAVACLALGADMVIVMRLFRCLTGDYCGPTVAHGWILLTMLGAVYLAFESMVALLSAMARKVSRDATCQPKPHRGS